MYFLLLDTTYSHLSALVSIPIFSVSLYPMVACRSFCSGSWKAFPRICLCEHGSPPIDNNFFMSAPVLSVSSHLLPVFLWRRLLLPFLVPRQILLWCLWWRSHWWWCVSRFWFLLAGSRQGLERIWILWRTLFQTSLFQSIPLGGGVPLMSAHQWCHRHCCSLSSGAIWRRQWWH